jgi:putative DNA primase/helicase
MDDLQTESQRLKAIFRGASPLSHGLGKDLIGPDGLPQRNSENKVESECVHLRGPATDQMFIDHLAGRTRLGLVPVTPEGLSSFGGIDIDRYGPPPTGYKTWTAFYQYLCQTLNLQLNSTATRSGGTRLIAFFQQPVPTPELRAWLRHVLPLLDLPETTEIFPKQDRVSSTKLGNYFFLPFFGEQVVPDQIVYASLSPVPDDVFEPQEEKEQAYGLRIRKGLDPLEFLRDAGLAFSLTGAGDLRFLNYHVSMQQCLVKGSLHEGNRTNERCCRFGWDTKRRLLWHNCFDSDCQSVSQPTRVALERLDIRLQDLMDFNADFSDQSLVGTWTTIHQEHVKFVEDARTWMAYANGLWTPKPNGPLFEIGEYLKGVSPGLPTVVNNKTRPQATLHYRLHSQRLVSSLLILAKGRPELAIRREAFDPDAWLLGLPEGRALDLRTGETRNAVPNDLITKALTVGPGGECPEWMKYLETALPNAEVRAYLRRFVGYCLTASVRENAILFLIGIGGSGKGTFAHPIQKLLGPYAKALPKAALLASTDADRQATALAEMPGVRLVVLPETPAAAPYSNDAIKRLTGGDINLSGRRLHQDYFTFTPVFKPIIMANKPPKIDEIDEALKQRIHVVKFERQFRGTEQDDKNLKQKLEKELGGILTWAIQGCLEWQEKGLQPPEIVINARNEYLAEADSFEAWLGQYTAADSNGVTTTEGLFSSWHAYCERTGQEKLAGDMKLFVSTLKEKRPALVHKRDERKGGTRKMSFFGIKLTNEQGSFDEF